MRRLLAILLVLSLGTAACASAGAKGPQRTLPELADDTSRLARRFTQRTRIVGHELLVTGRVEDSYRYEASVAVDGVPAYEEVVVDDARYVRVLSARLVAIGADPSALASVHPAYATALAGAWVVDPKGASPEFRPATRTVAVPLNPDLVFEAVRFLDVVPAAVAPGARPYNKDSVTYLPKNDKFRDIEVPDTERHDVLPAGYDTNAVIVHMAEVRHFFQYTALWVDDRSVRRFESRVELPDPADPAFADVYRQIGQAGSASLQSLVAAGPSARLIADSYVVEPAAVTVAVPQGATPVDLAPAFAAAKQSFGALAQLVGPLTARPS